MNKKFITNVGVINHSTGTTPLMLGYDTVSKKFFVFRNVKIETGVSPNVVTTYESHAISRTVYLNLRGMGKALISDQDVDVSVLIDGTMSGIIDDVADTDGDGKVTIDNYTPNATDFAKGLGTVNRSIVGTGITISDYLTSAIYSFASTPTGNGSSNTATTDLETARKKSLLFGVIGSFRSTNATPTFLDNAINWILDNTYVAIIGLVVLWNYWIQPMYFPDVTFLTWGKKKGKGKR